MTRAAGAGALTPRAGCPRFRAHEHARAGAPERAARAGVPAAGAARRDPGRAGNGDVRDHLLPPVVPAGPLGRTVRAAGEREPRARSADRGAAWSDPGPRRPAAGDEPHDERGTGRALRAAPGGRAAPGA